MSCEFNINVQKHELYDRTKYFMKFRYYRRIIGLKLLCKHLKVVLNMYERRCKTIDIFIFPQQNLFLHLNCIV